jgi:hypothetical protein
MSLPLVKMGKLVFLEGEVDGNKGLFMLDFGSQQVALNSKYFEDYIFRPIQVGGVNEAHSSAGFTTIRSLDLGQMEFRKQSALVTDLTHLESQGGGARVLGLIGIKNFKDFELELNARAGKMSLYSLEKTAEYYDRFLDNQFEFAIPFSLKNNIMLIEAEMGNRKMKFGLDTGAEVSVLDKDLIQDLGNDVCFNERMLVKGSTGTSSTSKAGAINEMRLNSLVRVQNLQAVALDLKPVENAYFMQLDGLLGFDFFDKGVFSFNFSEKYVRIVPHNVEVINPASTGIFCESLCTEIVI